MTLLFILHATVMFPVDKEMPETEDDLGPSVCTPPALYSASVWNYPLKL